MTVLKAKIGGTYQAVLSGYASNVYIGPDPPTDPNIQFWVDSDATLPVVPWIPLTLSGTWVNFGGGYQSVSYRKVGDEIQLRGLVANPVALTSGVNIVTLPTGCRPVLGVMFSGASSLGNASVVPSRIDVQSDGQVVYQSPISTLVNYLSLNSVRFSVIA